MSWLRARPSALERAQPPAAVRSPPFCRSLRGPGTYHHPICQSHQRTQLRSCARRARVAAAARALARLARGARRQPAPRTGTACMMPSTAEHLLLLAQRINRCRGDITSSSTWYLVLLQRVYPDDAFARAAEHGNCVMCHIYIFVDQWLNSSIVIYIPPAQVPAPPTDEHISSYICDMRLCPLFACHLLYNHSCGAAGDYRRQTTQ